MPSCSHDLKVERGNTVFPNPNVQCRCRTRESARLLNVFQKFLDTIQIIVDWEQFRNILMHIRTPQSRLLCINEGNQGTTEKVHNPSTRLSNSLGRENNWWLSAHFFNPNEYPASAKASLRLKGAHISTVDVHLLRLCLLMWSIAR